MFVLMLLELEVLTLVFLLSELVVLTLLSINFNLINLIENNKLKLKAYKNIDLILEKNSDRSLKKYSPDENRRGSSLS